jgi:hypothetical protein
MSGADHARPFVSIRPWLRAGLLRYLSPTASRILFLLVDYCGTDGFSYPSAHTLAAQTGHARKVVYGALKELVAIGCLERKDGTAGQTRFNAGNRNPGPVYYWIGAFDDRAAQRLRTPESPKGARGDRGRFASKVSQTQEHLREGKVSQTAEHLEPPRCSKQSTEGVPKRARQGVPNGARQGVPNSGTLRAFGPEPSVQSLLQSTPPSPPTGGTSATGGPSAEGARVNGSENGNGRGCKGFNKIGVKCGRKTEPDSAFCKSHQAQAAGNGAGQPS